MQQVMMHSKRIETRYSAFVMKILHKTALRATNTGFTSPLGGKQIPRVRALTMCCSNTKAWSDQVLHRMSTSLNTNARTHYQERPSIAFSCAFITFRGA